MNFGFVLKVLYFFIKQNVMKIIMDFKLKSLCIENKVNSLKLEKILNIPNARLGKYIKQEFYPSVNRAVILSNYFNCSLDYLVGLSPVKQNGKLNAPNLKKFFNRLDWLILEEKSITSFFKNCQLAKTNIIRWKKMNDFPRLENLFLISDYYKISLDYLTGRTDKMEINYEHEILWNT